MIQYLTDSLKKKHINIYLKYKKHCLYGIDFEYRDLKLDKELIPIIEEINKLPNIVVTQSCSGHRLDSTGYLCLAMNKSIFWQIITIGKFDNSNMFESFIGKLYLDLEKRWTYKGKMYPQVIFRFPVRNRKVYLTSLLNYLHGVV